MSIKVTKSYALYKGFELECRREKSMGGDMNTYYTIFRQSDGWCLADCFTSGPLGETSKMLYSIVDDYLENPGDYDDDIKTN